MEGGVITINWTLLWQGINMVIIYLLIRRYLYQPMANFMKNRQDTIANNLKTAEIEREEAHALRAQYEESIESAKQEAREIINNARKRSEEIISEGRRAAQEQGEQIIEKAKQDLVQEKEKVFKELKDEIALISVRIAERIIETKIDAAAQRQLVDRYLKEVKKVS